MANIKDSMAAATTQEQKTLAEKANTSHNYLYQLASGVREVSVDLAARLEVAAAELQRVSKGRLPSLTRFDMCDECAQCPYVLKCNSVKK
jgi:RNase P subunit RPR2